MKRNRRQVVAASLVLLALVVAVIGTSFRLVEAKLQERQEELAKLTPPSNTKPELEQK